MDDRYKPIGVFDSGLGGLSVLKEAVKLLPHEDFIYYGDTKNAPYGIRKVSEIRYLSNRVVDFLIDKDVKAIVIACNTATSAAVNELRDKYSIPIIGIEPALKPAVEMNRVGKIIIMATPVTLSEKKFSNLMDKYKKDAEIVSLPCPGLVEFIENGNIEGREIENYLEEKFKPYKSEEIAAIVLGCTHYPFIKKQIVKVIHKNVPIIDGSEGTSKQLKRKLEKLNLTNDKREQGNVIIYNSLEGEKVIELSYRLMSI